MKREQADAVAIASVAQHLEAFRKSEPDFEPHEKTRHAPEIIGLITLGMRKAESEMMTGDGFGQRQHDALLNLAALCAACAVDGFAWNEDAYLAEPANAGGWLEEIRAMMGDELKFDKLDFDSLGHCPDCGGEIIGKCGRVERGLRCPFCAKGGPFVLVDLNNVDAKPGPLARPAKRGVPK